MREPGMSDALAPKYAPGLPNAWQRLPLWWKIAYIYLGVVLVAKGIPDLIHGFTVGGASLLDALLEIPFDCLLVWIMFGIPRLIWLGGRWAYLKMSGRS